jgi:hypothetical protein
MNKTLIHNGVIGAMLMFATGCSSIVSKSDWPITFNSNPSGAQITITDKSGRQIHSGTTPTTLTLPAKSGYFQSARYDVELKLAGYTTGKGTVSAKLNGWYLGNIVFGGLIGMLIVDPATGAMWKLPDQYTVNLAKETAAASETRTLQIVSINDFPEELRSKLIKIQ